ncbi:MAG: peptide-methionine (S)-S-oxide reductase [Gammaproteobacteria bacterium]|jgi:peptide-methionine (S)-S-oxide reductase
MISIKTASFVLVLSLFAAVFSLSAADDEPTGTNQETAIATFAGGCFWCMEGPFDKLTGVISTTSGYTGGHTQNPTYKQTSSGNTGHTEAVQIVYDPKQVGYEKLLDVFWHNIDPTTPDQQFCDRGSQYRSEIFYHDDQQKQLADASKSVLNKSKPFKQAIVTQITKASTFYAAEDYHQDYYKKNPVRYKYYRYGCGRDKRLEQLWGEQEH